jgi:hypothetical protein
VVDLAEVPGPEGQVSAAFDCRFFGLAHNTSAKLPFVFMNQT